MCILRSVRSNKSTLSGAARRWVLFIGAQLAIVPGAEAQCVDPSALVKTTVSISRNFDAEERKVTPGIVGIGGTGWFLTPEVMVTAAHVSEAMQLSTTQWKDVEVWDGKSKTVIATRIQSVAGSLRGRGVLAKLGRPCCGDDRLP